VGVRQQLERMLPRVGQVMRQARARIFAGDTHAEGKIVSIFEPSTEVIRKGKPASRPSSPKWSSCKKRRIRSSSPMRFTIGGRATATC
jgi:hypothetical protein